jgi:hypothetical protein
MQYDAPSPVHGGQPQRRVTHTHEPNAGGRFVDDLGQERRHGAWLKKVGEVVELPLLGDYIRDIRNGDLFPADEATAAVVGFPFGLAGEQLQKAVDGYAVPHRWRDIAVEALKNKRSFYEEMKAEIDAEHGDEALAEHTKAVAALRGEKPSEVTKPKAVIV